MSDRISKVTTKSGDEGTTSLADGNRYDKGDDRVELVGTLDEANASLALVVEVIDSRFAAQLQEIQSRLFDVGAAIATGIPQPEIWPSEVSKLTSLIESLNADLAPLREVILPGGGEVAARTHMARTTVRRAERIFWRACNDDLRTSDIGKYLNRLSDYLFVLSRVVAEKEVLWQPLKPSNLTSDASTS